MADKNLTVNVKSKFDKSGFDKLNQNIDKTQANLKETTKGVSGLSAALVGGLAGAFASLSSSLIPFAINSIKAGAALQNLRAGFAGTAKDLELLRKATANTVSEAGLIALSNQAMDLGISLENQAKLFSLAEDAGDKYGGSLEENFQKIVLATDGSAKGLRAVGVSATEFKKKVEELVKVQGVKLEQLSAEEQLQLRLQAIFELTGTTMDSINKKTVDAADALEQLGLVAETAAASFGGALVTGIANANKSASDFGNTLITVDKYAKALGASVALYFQYFINNIKIAVDFLDNVFIQKLKQYGVLQDKVLAIPGGGLPLGKQIEDLPKLTTSNISTPGGSTANKTTEKAKELLTAIDEIQKKIAEKQEAQALYLDKGLTTTQAYLTLLQEIVSLETELATLRGGAVTSLEAANVPRLPIGEVSFTSTTGVNEALQAERDKAIEDGKMIYGNVTNILNMLGLATDNFVGKIIGGFNVVLSIMESIKAVNTILNVIPFLATGGIMQSSGLAVVGERGPELVSLPAGARVYNNQDTQRYFNSVSNTPQAVNVYVNADIDGLQFLRKNMPKYFSDRNYKRIN
jgi:hypothetical protein